MRGLIKEVLSLCAYVVAFLGAIWWGPRVSGWLEAWINNPLLRTGLAYLAVFLVVLVLVVLLNMTLATVIDKAGLTPSDHGLGAVLRLSRVPMVVMVLVTLECQC